MAARKVLVTGGTGLVAGPVVDALAATDEVWCVARFTDDRRRAELEARGVRTFRWELGSGPLDGLPDDFTHVLHAAAYTGADGGSWDRVIGVNCEGAGQLMTHCRHAGAFLFVSATFVYTPQDPEHEYLESDPTAGHSPFLPAYAVSKVAAEGTVRAFARTLGLPTTIARLGVVHSPRGWGGMAVRYLRMMQAGQPILVAAGTTPRMNPIHTDDIARQVPLLWDVARVPAMIVNWAGDECVTERELLEFVAEWGGVQATIEESATPFRSLGVTDNTRRRELIGDCRVGWRNGVARALEAHFPRETPFTGDSGGDDR